jgi:hypothetical protein
VVRSFWTGIWKLLGQYRSTSDFSVRALVAVSILERLVCGAGPQLRHQPEAVSADRRKCINTVNLIYGNMANRSCGVTYLREYEYGLTACGEERQPMSDYGDSGLGQYLRCDIQTIAIID